MNILLSISILLNVIFLINLTCNRLKGKKKTASEAIAELDKKIMDDTAKLLENVDKKPEVDTEAEAEDREEATDKFVKGMNTAAGFEVVPDNEAKLKDDSENSVVEFFRDFATPPGEILDKLTEIDKKKFVDGMPKKKRGRKAGTKVKTGTKAETKTTKTGTRKKKETK